MHDVVKTSPGLVVQVVEFLKWSVKHESPHALRGSGAINVNAGSVLRRLFERMVHPQPYQRCAPACQGACHTNRPLLTVLRVLPLDLRMFPGHVFVQNLASYLQMYSLIESVRKYADTVVVK